MVDVMVEMGFDCHIRISKAVVSLYDLYVKHLRTPCEDTGKYSMKLFLLDLDLPTDVEEDSDLVVQQIVCIPSVLLVVVPDLRELRDCVGVKSVIAGPAWRQRLVWVMHCPR